MKKRISILVILMLLFSTMPLYAEDSQNSGVVSIWRDDFGVPHIYADSVDDLYRAYGYVMASDRLFQLEMFRRGHEGTVAEVFGERYLERDQRLRRDGYSDEEIKAMILEMEPFAQEVIKNFALGITQYVEEALKQPDKKLSIEFFDYDVEPRIWRDIDVARLFMSSMTVFMDGEGEITNKGFLDYLKEIHGEETAMKIFDDFFWHDDPSSPVSVPGKEEVEAVNKVSSLNESQFTPGASQVALELIAEREDFVSTTKELGLPLSVGSNALLVAPEKSATGNTLVFSGPQVGFTAPGFIYEVGLHGPGIEIVGSAFIGYPFIMFGTTPDIAFASTAGMDNGVDIFKETLNPENPYQYKYNGEWIDMEVRVETFTVRNEQGEIKEVSEEFFYTVHGPVIYMDKDNNFAYSKAWAFRGTEMQSWNAFLKANWATNMEEYASAAREVTMALNWLYGDRWGNIGFYHLGKYPIRAEGVDLRIPTPGTGEYEWQGFIPPEDNPYGENPPSGYITNWNNKPAPNWSNGELSFLWGKDHRVQQFIDQVEARDKLTLEDINEINYHASFVNLKTRWFKPFLLEALESYGGEDERLQKAYDYIKAWNNLGEDTTGDGYFDSPGQTIFEAWWPTVLEDVFAPHLQDWYGPMSGIINHRYGSSLFLRVLLGEEATMPAQYDYLGGDRDEILINNLKKAIDKLEEDFGEDMSEWLTPVRTMGFGGTSLIGVQHGLGTDVQIPSMNRGSENHYIELTDEGPIGFNITPPGQIGFISKDGTVNKHYDDQIEMFAQWEFKPVYINEGDVREKARTVQYLIVGERSDKQWVPVRSTFESLGAEVLWDNDTRAATIVGSDYSATFTLDDNQAVINDRSVTMYQAPNVVEDRMFIPYEIIADIKQ